MLATNTIIYELTNASSMMLSNGALYINMILVVGMIWLGDLAIYVSKWEFNQGEVESARKQFLLGKLGVLIGIL